MGVSKKEKYQNVRVMVVCGFFFDYTGHVLVLILSRAGPVMEAHRTGNENVILLKIIQLP